MHSSEEASVDSPTWHLVQALNTLVEKDGHTPAVEGFFEKVKPLTAAQKKLIEDHAALTTEEDVKKSLGVQHWVHDASWVDSLMMLESQPTINIEGLVAGYTGPGGKDRPTPSGGSEDRYAPGAGYDSRGHAGEAEGAPGKARVWRYRDKYERGI